MSNQSQANCTLTKLQRKQNSYRIELVGKIVKEGSSALSILNEGDDRFDNISNRYAWAKVTPQAMHKHFSVSMEKMESMKVGDEIILNIENPVLEGVKLNIRVIESTEPFNEYEVTEWRKAVKQIEITSKVLSSSRIKKTSSVFDAVGEKGYFSSEGKLIFTNAEIVFGAAEHVFIKDATLITEREALNIMSQGVKIASAGSGVDAINESEVPVLNIPTKEI